MSDREELRWSDHFDNDREAGGSGGSGGSGGWLCECGSANKPAETVCVRCDKPQKGGLPKDFRFTHFLHGGKPSGKEDR